MHQAVYSVQSWVYRVHCTVHSMQCTVYRVQCTIQFTGCSCQLTVLRFQCTVEFTLYSVHCPLYKIRFRVRYVTDEKLYIFNKFWECLNVFWCVKTESNNCFSINLFLWWPCCNTLMHWLQRKNPQVFLMYYLVKIIID